MKIITTCDHVLLTEEQRVQLGLELFRKEHDDGRFLVVTEVCAACFTRLVIKDGLRPPR